MCLCDVRVFSVVFVYNSCAMVGKVVGLFAVTLILLPLTLDQCMILGRVSVVDKSSAID